MNVHAKGVHVISYKTVVLKICEKAQKKIKLTMCSENTHLNK